MKAIRLYAQVLVEVALAPGSEFKIDSILSELRSFQSSMGESQVFGKVFSNPTLSQEEKQKALGELTHKSGLTPISARFLSLLARRNRLNLLADILKEVETIEIEKRGGLTGELLSAVSLEAGVVVGIQDALTKRLHKPVQLKQKIDTSLIAGMRVTLSGVTYDGSIRGKLDKLSGSLATK